MQRIQKILGATEIDRVLTRLTHQILERVTDLSTIGIVGMQTRGVWLARIIAEKIEAMEGRAVPFGVLDTALYRDDYAGSAAHLELKSTDIPFDIKGKTIILVDDVLFTGRSVRAALDALMDLGRPQAVRLVVLADRGRRELPIRADFVGRKLTTAENQQLSLLVNDVDGDENALWLMEKDK